MKLITGASLAAILLSLAGCKTMGNQESYAAILSEVTPEVKLQVTKAVSTATGGKSVKIAEDVLTVDNKLTIVPNMTSTYNGNIINGRVQDRPQHFQLLMRGNKCYLLHDESGEEYTLENVSCVKM